MAFSWLGMFGASDYMHLRQFLLEELRNVGAHTIQIDAELRRIGRVRLFWGEDEDGNATEERVGFFVTPVNSTLNKLVKAYIAQGGNPFDICMFLDPELGVSFGENDDGSIKYDQPYGGLLTVKTRENPTSGFDAGGEIIYHKNPRLRVGKSIAQDRAESIGEQVASARGWANQAIREKRSDLEWQIVKLLDLSEQLTNERMHTLGQAVAEMAEGYALTEEYAAAYTMKEHLKTLDAIIFDVDEDTGLPIYGSLNVQSFQKGFYDFLTPPRQRGEDDWVGLKIPDGFALTGDHLVDVVEKLAAPTDGSEVEDV